MARAKKRETLTVAPNTLLGGLFGTSSSRKKSGLESLLLDNNLMPSVQRMWSKPLGRVALYALGVRPTPPETQSERKPRTQSKTRRTSTTKRSTRR